LRAVGLNSRVVPLATRTAGEPQEEIDRELERDPVRIAQSISRNLELTSKPLSGSRRCRPASAPEF
jgi:hypothetical protein